MIRRLTREKSIVVCVGPGGVGKTTTSAALGVLAARDGRRVLVSTIDPAPRLADALGVPLTAEPVAVPEAACRTLGIAPGILHVARLDTARAFANLVDELVPDAAMRRRIFENPIYRQITTTLTGSQEYAATLALYDVARRHDFELVVLDTPPTAHALDFLEAPRRIADAINSPVIGWFARPVGSGRFSLHRLRAGGALLLKRLAKFVGARFLEDVAAFLTDFQTVLGGFLERAQSVEKLLRREDSAFVLVLAPERPAVDEALFFGDRLRQAGISLSGFVANRVQPPVPDADAHDVATWLRARPELAEVSTADLDLTAERLARTALDLRHVAEGERRELARLQQAAPGLPVVEIPRLPDEASTLAALARIGDVLAGGDGLGRPPNGG
ncbi:MAG: ArsA-related P-loop ATPase [Pseudomonadota bacterium]